MSIHLKNNHLMRAPKPLSNPLKVFLNSVEFILFSCNIFLLCLGVQGASRKVLPPVQQPEGQPHGPLPAPGDDADAAGRTMLANQGQGSAARLNGGPVRPNEIWASDSWLLPPPPLLLLFLSFSLLSSLPHPGSPAPTASA